jgi:hypothetical protein
MTKLAIRAMGYQSVHSGPEAAPLASLQLSMSPSEQSRGAYPTTGQTIATGTVDPGTGGDTDNNSSRPRGQSYAEMVAHRHELLRSRHRLLQPCVDYDHQVPSFKTPGNLCSTRPFWPEYREARGFLRLSAGKLEKNNSILSLCSIRNGTLTLSVKPGTGDGTVDTIVAQTSLDELIVSIFPGRFDMFRICRQGEEREEIYCFAMDQTARNKWIAVFRRMRIAIHAPRPAQSIENMTRAPANRRSSPLPHAATIRSGTVYATDTFLRKEKIRSLP